MKWEDNSWLVRLTSFPADDYLVAGNGSTKDSSYKFHEEIQQKLPKGVYIAYDNLEILI